MKQVKPLLQAKGLCRSFKKLKAVDDVSFSIQKGACVGLIGANGAGKTTLLRILSTLDMPQSGELMYQGIDAISYPERVRPLFGWLPDALDAWEHMTVREFLDFVARIYDFKGQNRLDVVDYWMKTCGVTPLSKQLLTTLSKGEAQRVGFARMMIGDPQILLLDEPAAGLDPKARLDFKDLVTLLKAQGRTLIISSHILSELEEMCDSVMMMDKGRVLFSGSRADFTKKLQGEAGARMRLQALGSTEALMEFLEKDDRWLGIERKDSAIECSFATSEDDEALSHALLDVMKAQPLVGMERLQTSWEEGFIQLIKEERKQA